MDNWYPVSLAPRNGTPVNLWIEDKQAPPASPVTSGAWEHDDITERSHWRDFRTRYGTHTDLDRHIRGWRPLPRVLQSRGG
jgi:hypothetical protein